MTEELDWKGDPLPDRHEIQLNITRLSGEIALGREKIRGHLVVGLAETRAIVNDPDLRAAAAKLSRVTGQSVDEIVIARVQPAIDDFQQRLEAHDADTNIDPRLKAGQKRGAVTEAFFKNLGGNDV